MRDTEKIYEDFACKRSSYNYIPIDMQLITHEIMKNLVVNYFQQNDNIIVGHTNYKISLSESNNLLKKFLIKGAFIRYIKHIAKFTDKVIELFNPKDVISDDDFMEIINKSQFPENFDNTEYYSSVSDMAVIAFEITYNQIKYHKYLKSINFYLSFNNDIKLEKIQNTKD